MIRKVLSLSVFIFLFFYAHSQYSTTSFLEKEVYEYEKITILSKQLLNSEVGSERYPLPVLDFLNCTDLYGVEQLFLHNIEGELIYRSYDPTENINLRFIPPALYNLTISFENGTSRSLYLQRMNLRLR